ncbi:hypothetical protein I7I51_02162 [Histoplasma capsulatum]|uniref:Uncharacterized protein n=1 Tax=Ajellomyces capsulatus TaxID=5037 RepID=A0A8A1M9I2_AJECA|nr:hypothetical protein I7I51_02162 [Histoplasma capsulatum]
MDVDAVLRALKAVFLSAVTCLLLPIYPCFIVKFAAEKAADERRAEGLMQPIVGLTLAETEGTDRTGGRGGGGGGRRRRRRKRRRLSITPSILEEGHSGHCEEEQPSLKQPHQGQVPVAQAAGSQISSSPVVLPIASIPTAVRHQIQISISISIYIHVHQHAPPQKPAPVPFLHAAAARDPPGHIPPRPRLPPRPPRPSVRQSGQLRVSRGRRAGVLLLRGREGRLCVSGCQFPSAGGGLWPGVVVGGCPV